MKPFAGLTRNERSPFLSADDPPDREEKAFAAIEGSEDGFFTNNPWEPIREFGNSLNASITANGGLVLDVSINDPFSVTDTCRIALLWDDEVLAFGPLVVEHGSRFAVTVARVAGKNLTAWCTDEVALTVHDKRPLQEAAEVVAAIDGRNEKKDREPSIFEKLFEKYVKGATVVGAVGVTAVVIGAYFYLKGK